MFITFLKIACALIAVVLLLPIIQPFHTVDRLNHPEKVVGVTDQALALANGRKVPLPFVKRIPQDDPRFRDAVARGVEVDASGEAFGLLKVYPSCGMTGFGYSIRRVNLSALVGVFHPDCIDETIIPPEQIRDCPQYLAYPHAFGQVRDSVWHPLRRWQQLFESHKAGTAPQPNPTIAIATP